MCFVSNFDTVLMRMVLTQASLLRYTKLVFCHPENCAHSLVSTTESIYLTLCLTWFAVGREFLHERGPLKCLIPCKIKSTGTLWLILSTLSFVLSNLVDTVKVSRMRTSY